MNVGKMLAEALSGSYPLEGGGVLSLSNFASDEQLTAAAEAFLAKVREVEKAEGRVTPRDVFDDTKACYPAIMGRLAESEKQPTLSDFSFSVVSPTGSLDLGSGIPLTETSIMSRMGWVTRPGFSLRNSFFAERQIEPASLVGVTVTYGEKRFTVVSITPQDDDAYRVVMDPADHTGPVPFYGDVE